MRGADYVFKGRGRNSNFLVSTYGQALLLIKINKKQEERFFMDFFVDCRAVAERSCGSGSVFREGGRPYGEKAECIDFVMILE